MKMIPLDGRKVNTCSACKEEKYIDRFPIVQGRNFREHVCTSCKYKKRKKKQREVYVMRKGQ